MFYKLVIWKEISLAAWTRVQRNERLFVIYDQLALSANVKKTIQLKVVTEESLKLV